MVLEYINELLSHKWLILNTIVCLVLYQTVLRTWTRFTKQNIKFDRGLPILGSHYRAMLGRQSVAEGFQNLYEKFPNEKIIGFYELFGKASYLIRDTDVIKNVAIKDFDSFQNHSFSVAEHADPLMSKAMFTMGGQRWREMRSTMSPAFTGSKMRLMFGLLDDVGQKFTKYLKKDIGSHPVKKYELKSLFERLASDTIASCAFGMTTNSLENTDNEFYAAGQYVSRKIGLRLFIFSLFPRVMNFFRIRVFNEKQTEFFRSVTKGNMDYRKKNNVKRNDMIDLLIEAQKGTLTHAEDDNKFSDAGFATVEESSIGKSVSKKTEWSDDEFAAQGMTFFLAGFLGMVLQLSFASHELAVNPDVQKKLRDECKRVHEQLDGKQINYEILQKMKYLDMVISETLRRWPLAPMMDREVNKPYSIENTDGTVVQLNVGDAVWIPTQGLHMDAKYFPNPLKFDPERFSDENKNKEMAAAYMPFGVGPRNCIGSRFALMQAKAILYHFVMNFEVEKCDQTEVPLQLKKSSGSVEAANGFWVNIKSR